jgi:isocitrate dehydrogenase
LDLQILEQDLSRESRLQQESQVLSETQKLLRECKIAVKGKTEQFMDQE